MGPRTFRISNALAACTVLQRGGLLQVLAFCSLFSFKQKIGFGKGARQWLA